MQRAFTKQKKLIVIALAAATFSAPALAETANVSIYGVADLSYDFINNGTSAAGVAGASKSNVSSNISKLGFKGSEGLKDGLSAIWQIEQQINIDNSSTTTNTLASRNSFVGLKSDTAGTLLLGRHDTPYKLATRKLDPFNDSIADGRAMLSAVAAKSAAVGFDGRQPDSIYYATPVMSGFTGLIAYANLTETNTTAAATKGSLLSLAALYNAAPFFGSFAYEDHKLDNFRAGGKESAWKLGLGYTLDAFTLGFSYEKTNDNLGGSVSNATTINNINAVCAAKVAGSECYGHNAYFLSGVYKMDMNAINFTYGKTGQTGTTANTGANQISLGYDYGLSKRTKLYAIYSRISNKTASNYGFSQSTSAASSINGSGASPSVVSLGMKHTF